MLKTVRLFTTKLPKCYNLSSKPLLRKYLTSTATCDEAWKKRLESPYLKKINVSNVYYEIENQFLHFGKANALDIDLFANAIVDDAHIDEVEDVIHKLRLSPEAANLLPSTHHAFIKIMLNYGNIDDLLRILDDRLNYGIFMDDYCCILLLNHFLKEKNYKVASRIASVQMLQEDFSHPIVRYMSLFACHNYVLNPESWVTKETESQVDDKDNSEDDEEEFVRVRYIRNYFFDDHFDLRDPNALVGKTLWMIGNDTPDILGQSYSLIGFTLHEKWDKLKEYINHLLKSKENPVVFKDSISIVRDLITQNLGKNDEAKQEDILVKTKDDILNLLKQLESSDLVLEEDLLKVTENRMKMAIQEQEMDTIKKQIQIYELWEKDRERLIKEHIDKIERDKTLAEIEAAKQKLKQKEEELFFFENEDKLDVTIENKRVHYPKKWLGKKKGKRAVDTEYIPPEIEKRREN